MSDDEDQWSGRPVLARLVRAAVVVGPLLLSLVVSLVVTRAYPAPQETGTRVAWWAGLLLLATGTVWSGDRALRRLLPLAALLEMSVLFPGRAPSRFAVARTSGSTRQLEELVARARESDDGTEPVVAASRILALVGALRSHDRATRGHSERVRVLTDLVAEEMGLSQPERDRLRWAALLHDIGKLDVPAKILNKSGRPTAREWERLKRHPAAGAALAAPLLDWLGASAPVIVQHHERWDGLGYPNGLAGEQICVGARIVAVADAFEVMTAARSYKKAMSRAAALREVAKMSGSQFDPAAVRALLSISAPRLRWAIGPWAWLAQLPVIGSAPSLAGTAAAVAGQTAGAVTLGTAVGVGSLPPITPVDIHFATTQPASPAPAPARTSAPAVGPVAPARAAASVPAARRPAQQRVKTVPTAKRATATAVPTAAAARVPAPHASASATPAAAVHKKPKPVLPITSQANAHKR